MLLARYSQNSSQGLYVIIPNDDHFLLWHSNVRLKIQEYVGPSSSVSHEHFNDQDTLKFSSLLDVKNVVALRLNNPIWTEIFAPQLKKDTRATILPSIIRQIQQDYIPNVCGYGILAQKYHMPKKVIKDIVKGKVSKIPREMNSSIR